MFKPSLKAEPTAKKTANAAPTAAAKKVPPPDVKPPPTRTGDGIAAATEPSLKGTLSDLGYTVTGARDMGESLGMKTTGSPRLCCNVAQDRARQLRGGEHLEPRSSTPSESAIR